MASGPDPGIKCDNHQRWPNTLDAVLFVGRQPTAEAAGIKAADIRGLPSRAEVLHEKGVKQVTAVTSGSLHWHFARTLRHRTKAASTRRGGSAGPLNGGGIEANKHPQAYRRWPRVRPVIDDEKIQDLLQRACGRPVLREAILNQLLQAAMPERLCAEPGERTDRRYAHRLETVSRLLKNRDGSVLA